ncbi:MAG: hypothetical protein ACRECF_01215 [Methyloceanibacter sp.]
MKKLNVKPEHNPTGHHLRDTLWPRLEGFASKDTVSRKFNQLPDLRISIRRSRSVDDITRKKSESAVLWFSQEPPAPPSLGLRFHGSDINVPSSGPLMDHCSFSIV